MPSTTLESLVIEINGNSEKASEGIGKLIGSLRSLRSCVSTVAPPLRTLNADLRAIALNSRDLIKTADAVRAITKAVNATKAKSGVMPEFKNAVKNNQFASWMYGPNPKPTISGLGESNGTYRPPNRPGFFSFEDYKGKDWRQENDDATRAFNSSLSEIVSRPDALKNMKKATEEMYEAFQARQGGNKATQSIKQTSEALKDVNKAGKEAKEGAENAGEGVKKAGEDSEQTVPKFKHFQNAMEKVNGTMHRIGRMASTLLIRTALRSMIKAFGEAWTAVYNFSDSIGGQFASSIDSVKSALTETAITIVQTFAPLASIIVPVINVIAGAIQYLCSVIQSLLQLLGLTSELFGASASKIKKAGGGGGSGGGSGSKGKSKGLLADWDELNIIQSSSDAAGGSGGGSGGGGGSKLSDIVKTEVDAITSLLVGEGLVALGLFMCATGHYGWGIGMIIAGAASIAKVFTVQWGSLSADIKRELLKITAIIGLGATAIGAIMLFSGHVGIGIKLLSLGLANLAITINWGATVTEEVRSAAVKVLSIGGALLMALGAILIFSGVPTLIPKGIAMLGVGAGAMGGAIGLSWDGIVEKVKETATSIADTVKEKFGEVKTSVTGAFDAVKEWWNENIAENISKAWNAVLTFFTEDLFGSSELGGTILGTLSDAWLAVSDWWGDILTPISKAWNAVKEFFIKVWEAITAPITNAWNTIEQFWKGTSFSEVIEKAFAGVSEFFTNLFKPLSDAWNWIADIFGIGKKSATYTLDVNENHYVSYAYEGESGSGYVHGFASGGYDIPRGDLFIANEAGAELVGSMNGKTAVANNGQIIEGIENGVVRANSEQNALLRTQNDLLRQLIARSGNQGITPSAEWGQFIQRSSDMWNAATGR